MWMPPVSLPASIWRTTLGRVVDGDRVADVRAGLQLETAGRGRGVHADDLAVLVDERTAGVAGLDRRVRSGSCLERFGLTAGIARRDLLVEGSDAALHGRGRAALAEGVADRDDGVADVDVRWIAEGDRSAGSTRLRSVPAPRRLARRSRRRARVVVGPVPPIVTVMLVASAITWLLVSTSPARRDHHAGAGGAVPLLSVVLMLTSAGSTLLAIELMSSGPGSTVSCPSCCRRHRSCRRRSRRCYQNRLPLLPFGSRGG